MDWEDLRGIRDERLYVMDRYQLSIRYDSLTDAQRTELAQYRTDLLNLPQDYSTPEEAHSNIPDIPTWFN
tara:strand:- start:178 stop:387 length:210 start_codon:yes stop_codon:yes gene_type:complete